MLTVNGGHSHANGNSFGDGEGNEKTSTAEGWMFPGGSSGIQQLCNPRM